MDNNNNSGQDGGGGDGGGGEGGGGGDEGTVGSSLPPVPLIKLPRKGRRWSFDLISPFSRTKSKKSTSPTSPNNLDIPYFDHRGSLTSLQPTSGLQLPWKRGRRASQSAPWMGAFIVVHPTEEDSYVVTVEDEGELRTLVEAARMEKREERVHSYRVIVTATRHTRASTDSSPSRYKSCENLLQHLQAVAEHSANTDDRLTITTELLESEQRYLDSLQTMYEQYAEPLRKFSSLSKEDHRILFVGLEPIFKLSGTFLEKLDTAVGTWDTTSTCIGNLFSNKFWSKFDEYCDAYEEAKQFLSDRLNSDKEFENFCHLRQQNGILSLHALLFMPIKRIPEYDKYLNDLLDETDSGHPDFEDLSKAANRVKNMVKDREEEIREAENEQKMDTVQDRFPHDDLNLQDKNNKTQPKPRGLSLRRRSAPSAVVFRSLSGNRSRSSSALWSQNNMGRKDADTFTTIKQAADSSRLYIMEGPVQFAMGMQTQDRYIFLFSDLLLVAKQKNSTTFKLKFRVPLCDVWLSTCVDEVTELTRPLDRSFVIGWPTCNVAATFKDATTKDKWMSKLTDQVQEEKQRVEPKEIGLKVVLRDDNKSEGCQLTVGNTQQAKDVLQACLTQLNIPDSDSKDYKLWVWSDKEGSPYPLIGHETPFSIKVSQLREIARTRGEDNMTLAELSSHIGDEPSNIKCEFILKQKKSPKQHSQDEASHKIKKSKKSSPLMHIFKRGGRDVNDRRRDDKTNNNTTTPQGKLFGHPLVSVCDSDNNPPKPVLDLLTILFREGPHTTGILRKSANAKQSRELKERIDQGEELDDCHVTIVGSILKEYLRSLPDPLLMEDLHDEWIKIPKMESQEDKLAHVRQLLSRMPACNIGLLKRILCVLHHIQRESDTNKMNSFNLSLCISPSLLWHKNNIDLSSGAPAVEFMIDKCADLFGEDVLRLLGDPQQFKSRQDSGTDSDSMHSVLSMQESGGGLRRDDSSIDSLVERDLYTGEGEGGESSPKLVKSHLSPSNLSRDSGLTLSDSQLYDDDSTDHSDPRNSRGYHRDHSHFHDSRDEYEYESFHHCEATVNPVPPPRKRRHGGGESEHSSSRMDSGGGLRSRDKRHTLHNSVSSSQLLDHCPHQLSSSLKSDSYRSKLTHPSFNTQMSEDFHHPHHHHGLDRDEIQEYRKQTMDIGMLKKSASGAHLIMDDETALPRKFSESSGMGMGSYMPRQQSSGVDSTPPLSPQSKYSFSSRDSAISDSSFGAGSRESSIHSQPQTPDADYIDRLPPWLPAAEIENQRLAMSLDLQPQRGEMVGSRLSASYNTSDLRSVQNVRYLVSPPASPVYELEHPGFTPISGASRQEQAFQAPPPSPWPGKSREAEDITLSASPQIQITQCSSDEKLDERGDDEDSTPRPSPNKAFPLEIPHGTSKVTKQMHKYSHSTSKGSPPPRVILDNLRSPRRGKDPAPVRASHDSGIVAQVQRGGGLSPDVSDASSGFASFDAARSMDAINDAEYIPVKPRLTVIRREESMTSNVSSYSSGSGSSLGKDSLSSATLSTSPSGHSTSSSSSGGSNHTLSGDRPSRPPEYTEALQRKFMIQRDLPMEAATQKSASEKAKQLYEDSLQKYLQDRYEQKHEPITRKVSDPGISSSSSMGSHSHSVFSSSSSHQEDRAAKEDVYVTLKNQKQQQQKQQEEEEGYKHPKQIYLDSVQRYEQQATVCSVDDAKDTTGFSRTVKSVSESYQKVLDSSSNESQTQERTRRSVRESRTRQRFMELSETRTSVKRDTQRPQSMLEIPASSLHRSLSDSADRLNKLGQRSPRSHSQVRDSDSKEQQYQQQQQYSGVVRDSPRSEKRDSVVRDSVVRDSVVRDSEPVLPSSRRKVSEPVLSERRERSESSPAHQYFPAASCFYRPEDSPRSGKSSPASAFPRAQSPRLDAESSSRYSKLDTSVRSARVPDNTTVRSSRVPNNTVRSSRVNTNSFVKSSSKDNSAVVSPRGDNSVVSPRGSGSRRVRCESPVMGSPRTTVSKVSSSEAHSYSATSVGRSTSGASTSGSVASTATSSSSSSSANTKSRTELGWSVKSLMKNFTAEQQASSSESSVNSSRPAPPPYQDPPPFRRQQDLSRLSTSSNSSNGSSSTGRSASPSSRSSTSSSRRLGPQNMSVDSSSSEELAYYNSRWSRARSESSGGLSDQEVTSSYTDISYV
ncbi:uncharacterized protein [Littorina saxatilis]|uniref:Uncharacterized protein n=1 Tax=Littorina saxatilis TaxID=31220 RepID=A0AAN9BL76_9CAEN